MQTSKSGWLRQRAIYAGLLIAVAALAIITERAVAQKPHLNAARPQTIEIHATPLTSFDRPGTSQKTFGRLEWRGGLVLSSPSPNFGGWSGLVLDPSGRRLLSVSDAGSWMTGEITYDNGRPTGIKNAKISSIRALNGAPLTRTRDRDAESITLADGTLETGMALIAFEGNMRIGRFPIKDGELKAPVEYLKKPAETRRMHHNASFESIGVLKAGRYKDSVIAIAERLTNPQGDHTGWIWTRGQPRPFYLSDVRGFDITDLATLPDGNVIVLERRFRWTEGVKMRLRLLNGAELAPGARLEGETLLEADMGYEIDNMEGVAVHEGPRGETIITVLSDNNFSSFIQRTVLLQFALPRENTASIEQPKRNR